MCATATKSATKTETKTKTKATKTSKAKVEANRRNAQKSRGPTSADGKARSRYNALKHGMTAKTVLLPGDDPQEFAGRLRYLQDDLQARNSLEAVVIERLAGDLWKSDRSDRSFCNRINFRLRHESDDQARKDADEAVELGQHLLWQPEFPLPVGLFEGEVKGALAKFPLADVPGDPKHPARLLLKLQATVAGCDWLLKRWDELRFRLENGGPWVMEDVWKMVRLLGKTAIEMKDDFQVALLVLASLALEPEPARKPTFAEAMSAMSRNDGLSRVVEGITRLCEPFQQALARMPLDKLAPENEAQARQRLSAVVEEELGRIGRIRARLQKIADADLAEAPVRLAFETGTEGDRQRRYVLSYERLVNRRIDTFLKVRKASGSGELDLIELQKSMGADKLRELIVDAGIMTSPDPGDLRSGDGRGRETRAQQGGPIEAEGATSHGDPEDLRSGDGRGRENRAQREDTRAQRGETAGQPPASANGLGSGSARVSDPAATPDRRSPVSELPNTSTAPAAVQSDANAELPSVSLVWESACDDESILRNEATAEPNDLGGCGRLPQGDAPGAELAPPGARWTSQLDPSHPALVTDRDVELQPFPQHEPTAAQDDPPTQEIEDPAGLVATVDSGGNNQLSSGTFESRSTENRDRATVSYPPGDHPHALAVEPVPPTVAPAAGPATVRAPRPCLTPEQLLHNQRVIRYRAMKGLSPL